MAKKGIGETSITSKPVAVAAVPDREIKREQISHPYSLSSRPLSSADLQTVGVGWTGDPTASSRHGEILAGPESEHPPLVYRKCSDDVSSQVSIQSADISYSLWNTEEVTTTELPDFSMLSSQSEVAVSTVINPGYTASTIVQFDQ